MATVEQVYDQLRPLIEPEIGLPMVDLGLIYGVDMADDGATCNVRMTLTSPMCPIAPYLMEMVRQAALQTAGLEDATVEIVWDPPWDPRVMATEDVRIDLGLE
jgi:metal-sulfur cluster biosynthetic enzyme